VVRTSTIRPGPPSPTANRRGEPSSPSLSDRGWNPSVSVSTRPVASPSSAQIVAVYRPWMASSAEIPGAPPQAGRDSISEGAPGCATSSSSRPSGSEKESTCSESPPRLRFAGPSNRKPRSVSRWIQKPSAAGRMANEVTPTCPVPALPCREAG
jgi:hypothetical protein